jgi:hypothetical protein
MIGKQAEVDEAARSTPLQLNYTLSVADKTDKTEFSPGITVFRILKHAVIPAESHFNCISTRENRYKWVAQCLAT